jgi:hypothetical protein
MRPLRSLVALSVLLLGAAPAGAGTWQIGPSIGMDVFSSQGSTITVVSAPAGPELLLAGIRPGLRIGSWDNRLENEIYVDTGFLFLSSEGSTVSILSNTLNYAHAFGRRSAPYFTLGLGFSRISFEGDSQTSVLYGGGVGIRERLRHGHGSIRTELRIDRADSQESYSEPVNIIGVHVGFDLDLD